MDSYSNGLRTHYSPIHRKQNFLKHNKSCKSYIIKDPYNHQKYLNRNINHIYTEALPSKSITHNKADNNEYFKYPHFNYHYRKKNLKLNISEKEKLNKSFNRVNPYYFQDKVKSLEKGKINEKVLNRILLQRDAIMNLTLNKIKNPSEKEKLQKINELSENPMISYESKPPFQIKTLNNFYINENLIKKNYINFYNKPRKEVDDYYNKCLYQIPINANTGTIIHTKGNYIYPSNDKKYVKEILDKQVECKNNKKKNKFMEDEKNRRIKYKYFNDYENYLKNKEKEEKLSREKEIMIDNNLLEKYKNYKNNYFHDGEKEYIKIINKKMEEDDLQRKYEEKQAKLKTMKNLREWSEINKKIQENKKKEKNKEKKIWRNYSEIYIMKCKHGNELYRCCRCGNKYTRDQVHKVIY